MASRSWLQRYLAEGGLLIAPMLLLAEVAGAISRQTQRPLLGGRAVERLLKLPGLRLLSIDQQVGGDAAGLAAELGLRGADAAYVAVACLLNLPLVTWDQEQRERAGRVIAVRFPEGSDA